MAGLSALPWVAVALADIQNARPGALVTAFQSTALASGQADPTLAIVQKVTAEVLGAVGFSGRYVMDASQGQNGAVDVLPPNLFDFAVEKCCRMMEKRLAMPWTPDETKDEERYQKVLVDIREGRYPVDATSNPSGSNVSIKSGQVSLNCGQRRRFQPCDLENL